MTNDQRKAMFARMRSKLSDQKTIKRAVIGAGMIGVGGAVAYRSPALRKKAIGLMMAGGATAIGYGGRAYQTVKDEAEKRGHSAQEVARQWKDWTVQEAHRKGGDAIANAIDAPFSWMEGLAAGSMDRRMKNVESVLAKRLSGVQQYATGVTFDRARKLSHLNLAPPSHAVELRTKFRREVDNKRWETFMNEYRRAALQSGHQFFNPGKDLVQQWMIKAGIPETEQKKMDAINNILRDFIPRHSTNNDFMGA